MKTHLQAWQILVVVLASLFNRDQQRLIEYLVTLVRVLLEERQGKRLILNDDQRRRLAVKGRLLSRRQIFDLGLPFHPDTILRWHRKLVAKKWDYTNQRNNVGRPKTKPEIVKLILRFAKENPSWGYDRIQGALGNLGHKVSDQTIGNILRESGIEPAPDRKRTGSWSVFLKAHWDVLAAVDFTTVEVWTTRGLITFYLLFVMELKSRRVHFAGSTVHPHTAWIKQVARNLTDWNDGFLKDKKYLIMDRDSKFCEAFQAVLKDSDVTPVILPPRSPNLNAHLERFFGSLKQECLDQMIFFGERPLRNAVKEYLAHYHGERNHQGLDNRLVDPGEKVTTVANPTLPIQCRKRLGGMLRYYHRAA